LQIMERLANIEGIELLSISDELRKDVAERKRFINEADIVFLCLPDAAAKESASLCENKNTVIIDASTAHRTNPGWTYGFPELSKEQEQAIIASKRIANPGCHATGFISLVYPLVKGGILPKDYPLVCHSITGYSGGGKKMIADYNEEPLKPGYDSPRQYALTQAHKHLPEMKYICGLDFEPMFSPIVSNFYAGMVVSVPVHASHLKDHMGAKEILSYMKEYYKDAAAVKVMEEAPALLDASTVAGRDDLEIYVTGNEERVLLMSRFDNLGKGASGAAVQCMKLKL
ncbi:MAG: N-acetyl-gamma-glutamyl-phosphate reductase, partial [Clostridiales bacterium]|nr:N-acetyl-gamma-glutamyl-phosphate reductase [Clostridiales bacterium]